MKEISYKNAMIKEIAANAKVRVYKNPGGGGINIDIHYLKGTEYIHLGQLFLSKEIDVVKITKEENFEELLNRSYDKPNGYYRPEKIKDIQIDRNALIEIFYRAPSKKDKGDIKLSREEKDSIYVAFNFLNETKEIFEAPGSDYVVF